MFRGSEVKTKMELKIISNHCELLQLLLQNNWWTEMLQSDRSWMRVYIVKCVRETLQFCRINQARRLRISMDKTQNVPLVTPSSVNSVTSIALHGHARQCVSATEAGYHNRNLIQPFYSREETRCIPSNNRHCVNIHVSLCKKSDSLYTRVCMYTLTFSRIMMEGCCALFCVWVCVCVCTSIYINHPNSWTTSLSVLVNMSGTGLKEKRPTFLKVMKCLMRGCPGNGHVKTSTICPH